MFLKIESCRSCLVVALVASQLISAPLMAQVIKNESPRQGDEFVSPDSAISASFQAGEDARIVAETVKLYLNEIEFTDRAIVTEDFFSYQPGELPLGKQEVLVEFMTSMGDAKRVRWSFIVGKPTRAIVMDVGHNGESGVAAGEYFEISAKGTPQSSVEAYLVRDSSTVNVLPMREVKPGHYHLKIAVEDEDSTARGVLFVRLTHSGESVYRIHNEEFYFSGSD